MFLPEGRIRTVTQMQMIVWPDLEAPEDARYNLTKLNLMTPIQATGRYGSEGGYAAGKSLVFYDQTPFSMI